MLETVFDSKDIALLRSIAKVANACGCNIFLIGGVVRDILLGQKPKDIDIVVVGDAISLVSPLKDRLLCKVVNAQKDLKTVKLEFRSGFVIDFASTRKEFYTTRKGMPIATHFGCPLKDDVLRRDFTVNSLAISLNSSNFEHIVDFVNGQEDLKNKTLKILHDNSFNDDPTRIIRGFKFAHRLGFHLDEHTKQLQEEYLENRDYSEEVSPVRIKNEMFEVFALNSVEIIEDFIDKKIFKVLSDKINDVKISDIKDYIEKYNITEDIPFVYFASLFFNEDNYEIIRQFNLTRKEIKIIQYLKFAEKFDGKLSPLEIYQQYSTKSIEGLVLELLLKNNSNIKKYFESLTDIQIEITGEDLLILGVPESKSYSKIFDRVLEEKINGNLPDKSSELRFVRKLLAENKV